MWVMCSEGLPSEDSIFLCKTRGGRLGGPVQSCYEAGELPCEDMSFLASPARQPLSPRKRAAFSPRGSDKPRRFSSLSMSLVEKAMGLNEDSISSVSTSARLNSIYSSTTAGSSPRPKSPAGCLTTPRTPRSPCTPAESLRCPCDNSLGPHFAHGALHSQVASQSSSIAFSPASHNTVVVTPVAMNYDTKPALHDGVPQDPHVPHPLASIASSPEGSCQYIHIPTDTIRLIVEEMSELPHRESTADHSTTCDSISYRIPRKLLEAPGALAELMLEGSGAAMPGETPRSMESMDSDDFGVLAAVPHQSQTKPGAVKHFREMPEHRSPSTHGSPLHYQERSLGLRAMTVMGPLVLESRLE